MGVGYLLFMARDMLRDRGALSVVPPGEAGSVAALLRLGAVFMGLTLVVFAVYGLCAAAVRDRLPARPGARTGLRRVFAACFLGLSARLAVA
ncbi:hypothetical protein [Streptomyces sp. NPDC047097]|uniref:hypothetical protein n=1 Tax=Streptomyces sp. NPDC047097 TaxID=3155260 RepID=UPI0033E4B781